MAIIIIRILKKCYISWRNITENLYNTVLLRKNKVEFLVKPIINGLLFLRNNGGSIHFEEGIKINSRSTANPIGGDTRTIIVVGKNALLRIGEGTGISNTAIVCQCKIIIGKSVLIGGGTKIWDTDFHPINPEERISNPNEGFSTKEISIGDNVFIGGSTIILKGVNIGENSIIGAGSVVTKSVPSNEIWAGNPARFIRRV